MFALIILVLLIPPHIMIPMFLNFRFFSLLVCWISRSTSSTYSAVHPDVVDSYRISKRVVHIHHAPDIQRDAVKPRRSCICGWGKPLPRAFQRHAAGDSIVFLFSVVWQWNDIFYTGLYLKDASFLPNKMLGVTGAYVNYFVREQGLQPKQVLQFVSNAAMVMFIAPVLIPTQCFRAYFVESVERTGLAFLSRNGRVMRRLDPLRRPLGLRSQPCGSAWAGLTRLGRLSLRDIATEP